MFTVSLKEQTINKQALSRFVTVTFTDGSDSFDETFRFALNTPIEDIKRTVKKRLEEINVEPEEITGDIDDYTEPTEPEPDAATIAQQEWLDTYNELKGAVALESLGVSVATEAQLTALRNKVKSDFKREYASLINFN